MRKNPPNNQIAMIRLGVIRVHRYMYPMWLSKDATNIERSEKQDRQIWSVLKPSKGPKEYNIS